MIPKQQQHLPRHMILGKQFDTVLLKMGEEFAPAVGEITDALILYAPAMIEAAKATAQFLTSIFKGSKYIADLMSQLDGAPTAFNFLKLAILKTSEALNGLMDQSDEPLNLFRPEENTDILEGIYEQLGLEQEIRQTFGDEQAALEEERRLAKEKAEASHSKKVISIKKKEKTALTKAEVAQFKFDQQMSTQKVSLLSSTQQLINTLNTGNNKAAFIASKALAAAQITMAGLQSIAGAVAFPPIGLGPVAGAPLAALMKVNMGVQLATLAATTFQGMAQGGLVAGGIPGMDSVPIMAQRGELVVPQQNFDEVISAVSGARDEGGGVMEHVITFKDEAFEIIESRLIERQSLGIGA